MKGLQAALYVCLILTLGMISGGVWLVSQKLAHTLDSLDSALVEVKQMEVNTTRVEAELGGLTNVIRQVALDERKSSAAQLQQIATLGDRTTKLIEHADQTIVQADEAIKAFGNSGDQLTITLAGVSRAVNQTSIDTHALLVNATTAIDVDTTHQAMQNVATSTQNLVAATGDAAASMATVRHGVEVEVAQLTAPPRKLKWLAEEIARIAGRFFGY